MVQHIKRSTANLLLLQFFRYRSFPIYVLSVLYVPSSFSTSLVIAHTSAPTQPITDQPSKVFSVTIAARLLCFLFQATAVGTKYSNALSTTTTIDSPPSNDINNQTIPTKQTMATTITFILCSGLEISSSTSAG